MTTKKASERTFGIEIECYIPTSQMAKFARGSYHNGLQCPGLPEGWKGEEDSSVCSYAPSGYTGIEIVSPILTGEAGLYEMWAVETLLHEIGAIVNDHCGHHVHVDMADLDEQHAKLLVEEFASYEHLFYAMCGDKAVKRYNSGYCRPIRQYGIVGSHMSRYRSLNLHNAWVATTDTEWRRLQYGHGTVECRCFPGNILPVWACTWVYMFVGLVSMVAAMPADRQPTFTWQTGYVLPLGAQVDGFVKQVLGNADCLIIPDETTADLEEIIRHQVGRAIAVGF